MLNVPLEAADYSRSEYEADVASLVRMRDAFLSHATNKQKKAVEWLERVISSGINMDPVTCLFTVLLTGTVDGAQQGLFTESHYDNTKFLAVALVSRDRTFIETARTHLFRCAAASDYDVAVHPTAEGLKASLLQHEQEVAALVRRAMTTSLHPLSQAIYDAGDSIRSRFAPNPLRNAILEGAARDAFIEEVKAHRQRFLDAAKAGEKDKWHIEHYQKGATSIASLLVRWAKPDRIVLRAKDMVQDMKEIADERANYSDDALNVVAGSFNTFLSVHHSTSRSRARG